MTGVALAEGGATAPSSSEVVLKRGDRGKAVERVQVKLGVEPADGVFGRGTERAVKRFQRRRGLTADGVVGRRRARRSASRR